MKFVFTIPNARSKIKQKTKILTMRKPWKNGKGIPKIGETLYLKDGNRWVKAGEPGSLQPIYVDGKNPACTGVWPVEISAGRTSYYLRSDFLIDVMEYYTNLVDVAIDKNYFSEIDHSETLDTFAIMDGWNNAREMFDFFTPRMVGGKIDLNLIYWGKK